MSKQNQISIEQPFVHDEKGQNPKDYSGKVMLGLVIFVLIGTIVTTAILIVKTDGSNISPLTVTYAQDQTFFQRQSRFQYSPAASRIQITATEDSDSELTIKIVNPDKPGFELPEDSPYFPSDKNKKKATANKKYTISVTSTQILVQRNLADGKKQTIFDTKNHQLVVSDNYIQIGTSLKNQYLYGLGERRQSFRYRGQGNYTSWPKDQFTTFENGQAGHQLYGMHSMWLLREEGGFYSIGFLKTTAPLLTEVSENDQMIHHILGGNIVLKFFIGGTDPEEVTRQYHDYINGWKIFPFWSHGYHQCRWGYKTSGAMVTVIDNFDQAGHPIDVIWNDLDYMTKYQDFTLDTTNFKKADFDGIRQANIKWVPLVDIGVAVGTPAGDDGIAADIFLKSSLYKDKDNKPAALQGCVWPGEVYFPDFNHPKAGDYWLDQANKFTAKYGVQPDGYWIDMNELASFIAGERNSETLEECPGANPPQPVIIKDSVDDRLYFPINVGGSKALSDKSVTINTTHYSGEDALLIKQKVTEQFFHSLNNLGEQIQTDITLQKYTGKKLSFSLTRASVFGSGRYTAHWTGDNGANWDFLKSSIGELLPFQLYGIPMVGNDLCGFAGSTNAQLCARWLALGAWQPFARNHNDNVSISQEPYIFQEPYVLIASKKAFETRYSYLRWMYAQFLESFSITKGYGVGTVIQPLWWFSNDPLAFQNEDTEFFFGKTFLITPVLSEGDKDKLTTDVSVYFPGQGYYYSWQLKKVFQGGQAKTTFTTKFEDEALYFQREGTIAHWQTPRTRTTLLDGELQLQIFLGAVETAKGSLVTLRDLEENNVHAKCLVDKHCVSSLSYTNGILTIGDSDSFETLTIVKVSVVDKDGLVKVSTQRIDVAKGETTLVFN